MTEMNEAPKNEGVRPVVYDLVARVEEFGVQDRALLNSIINWVEWALGSTGNLIADKNNADELLALAVHSIRSDRYGLTAEEHYELERWIDFLGVAYAKIWYIMERPRRGRRPKNVTDGQCYKLWWFPAHPSEFPDVLPDWSTVPCVVSEDAS